MKKAKIFFLPFAGASVSSYLSWKNYFSDKMEPCFLEFKGRGSRFEESYYESIEEAVIDIFQKLKEKLDNEDYYIFGHSLGGMVTFELLLQMQHENFKMPNHVFISGREAPVYRRYEEIISDKPDEAFMDELARYDGVPEELYNNEEMRKVFLPVLRADIKLIERYEAKVEKVYCDITIFYGMDDNSITLPAIFDWKKYAGKEIVFIPFDGGHFYCMKEANSREIVSQIEKIHERIREERKNGQ